MTILRRLFLATLLFAATTASKPKDVRITCNMWTHCNYDSSEDCIFYAAMEDEVVWVNWGWIGFDPMSPPCYVPNKVNIVPCLFQDYANLI